MPFGDRVLRTRRRAAACALLLALAGCARSADPQPAPSARADPAPPPCPTETALLTRQPAPDCEFKAADFRTVDADEFARLKLAYERQCYQHAEKVARERLNRLQAVRRCEVNAAARARLESEALASAGIPSDGVPPHPVVAER